MEIYILNTLETCISSIDILKEHLNVRGIIGLSEKKETDNISGYKYLKNYCENNNLNFIEVESYSLSEGLDKKKLLSLKIDILIVAGWQRLIPSWLIDHCKLCAIGSHGSAHGISSGRGRSPQNWALIMGQQEFFISIFKIDNGIDSGLIIDTKQFNLSNMDDIKTSYYKVNWLTSHMIINCLRDNKLNLQNAVEQKDENRYLPQRLPEDGEIDWSRTSRELYNFVRALTRPYPGAFSYIEQFKIKIWKCRILELACDMKKFKCGEIVKAYSNGDFLVKTADSFLLVEDYSFASEAGQDHIKEQNTFSSCSFTDQMNNIINRHYNKSPELILSDDIIKLAKG
ncbi:MAG: methionyl-tRNA formyltransferase [Planctomycetota bacterium]|jgi:UDP-4-amino-4-deoxy-L-arabinose formyltransferase/UDP-glucuronic acid dehydrogenase (UDP-4-keto-hexauronic acid decarboxylating)